MNEEIWKKKIENGNEIQFINPSLLLDTAGRVTTTYQIINGKTLMTPSFLGGDSRVTDIASITSIGVEKSKGLFKLKSLTSRALDYGTVVFYMSGTGKEDRLVWENVPYASQVRDHIWSLRQSLNSHTPEATSHSHGVGPALSASERGKQSTSGGSTVDDKETIASEILDEIQNESERQRYVTERTVATNSETVWRVLTETESYHEWVGGSYWQYEPIPTPPKTGSAFRRWDPALFDPIQYGKGQKFYEESKVCVLLRWEPEKRYSYFRGRIDEFELRDIGNGCAVKMTMTTLGERKLTQNTNALQRLVFNLKPDDAVHDEEMQRIADRWIDDLERRCLRVANGEIRETTKLRTKAASHVPDIAAEIAFSAFAEIPDPPPLSADEKADDSIAAYYHDFRSYKGDGDKKKMAEVADILQKARDTLAEELAAHIEPEPLTGEEQADPLLRQYHSGYLGTSNTSLRLYYARKLAEERALRQSGESNAETPSDKRPLTQAEPEPTVKSAQPTDTASEVVERKRMKIDRSAPLTGSLLPRSKLALKRWGMKAPVQEGKVISLHAEFKASLPPEEHEMIDEDFEILMEMARATKLE
ncbi:MAG: hypothetical protein AAFY56_21295 [Pseudomonadota bacterium]